MTQELLARVVVITALVSVGVISSVGMWNTSSSSDTNTVQLYASMPENGGWSTDILYAEVGKPLHLDIISQDVIHGFAVGQMRMDDVELYPGIPVTSTLLFEKPGIYTFFCTRWCGLNHWRMRGTIEVSGEEDNTDAKATSRYVHMGMNIDAPHPAEYMPLVTPDSQRGAEMTAVLPEFAKATETYWQYSPAEFWSLLRAESSLEGLHDSDIWDLTSWVWSQQITRDEFLLAKQTYQLECAACHGEAGQGDGVMVRDKMPFSYDHTEFGHTLMRPPDWSDPAYLLGAPPAVLEGKILRGGMGTGMPLYGPIYTQEEIDALVNYLYTFVLRHEYDD